ncbi:MAG: SEC-C metal-binding domain-containing protein, partial [Candidatus Omnitrophota bacterium]|nr:SEC-C metal-binding domain-containing protein [Candidatus Omnitrophota bacterium]
IQLRAYGQRDPLLEYKHEAHKMFFEMEGNVRRKIMENLFRIQIARQDEDKDVFLSGEQRFIHSERSALAEGRKIARKADSSTVTSATSSPDGESRPEAKGGQNAPFERKTPKVGRNDPCPCGSGKKYKRCCGK